MSKVYCNTGRLGLECIAIQLANLYCEEAWPVSRYSGLGGWVLAGRAGTAQGRAVDATGVGGLASGRPRQGRCSGTRGACSRGARGVRSRGVAGTRPGRWARGLATGCALGALGLFSIQFDSALFLSRFLDIIREPVHEHCSSQIFSEKKIKYILNLIKNEIKSNKI